MSTGGKWERVDDFVHGMSETRGAGCVNLLERTLDFLIPNINTNVVGRRSISSGWHVQVMQVLYWSIVLARGFRGLLY